MALPTGPNLCQVGSVDTASTNGACIYPPQPIGPQAGFPCANVFVKGAPLIVIQEKSPPDLIAGTSTNPLTLPICIVPVPRTFINNANKTVHINKILPLVSPGDLSSVAGATRPILGPVQHPQLRIGAYAKKK